MGGLIAGCWVIDEAGIGLLMVEAVVEMGGLAV